MKVSALIAVLVTATGYAVAVPFNNTRIGVAIPQKDIRYYDTSKQEVIPSVKISKRHTDDENHTVKADITTHYGSPIVKRFEVPVVKTGADHCRNYTLQQAERERVVKQLWKMTSKLCENPKIVGKEWDEQCEKLKALELKMNGTTTH